MKVPLKWAGGKRWLVSRNPQLFNLEYKSYVEPFLGSGAVFFELAPKRGLLSDTNARLINFYKCIRRDPDKMYSIMQKHSRKHSVSYYYKLRDEFLSDKFEQAAQFLYLNRTCWNGLYRENLKGLFNVPKGTKDSVLFDDDDFSAVSRRLQKIELRVSEFEPIIANVGDGDFVFVDPPYTVKHNINGFVKYNEKIFSWADQVRLAEVIFERSKSGANFLITNAYHASVISLYQSFARLGAVSRASVIAGSGKHRGVTEELLIFVGPHWDKAFVEIQSNSIRTEIRGRYPLLP